MPTLETDLGKTFPPGRLAPRLQRVQRPPPGQTCPQSALAYDRTLYVGRLDRSPLGNPFAYRWGSTDGPRASKIPRLVVQKTAAVEIGSPG